MPGGDKSKAFGALSNAIRQCVDAVRVHTHVVLIAHVIEPGT